MKSRKNANYFHIKSVFLSGAGLGLLFGSVTLGTGRDTPPWQFYAALIFIFVAFILQMISNTKEVNANRKAAEKELFKEEK